MIHLVLLLGTTAVSALPTAAASALPPLPCAAEGQSYTPHAASWKHAGPAGYRNAGPATNVNNNITSAGAMQAAVATSGGAWLAATVNGGVWRTADIGAARPSWEPVTDGQPVRCSSISALSAASFDASLVFAGCGGSTSSEQGTDWNVLNDGDWGGVMFSRDGGSSWAMTSFPPGHYVTAVLATSAATGELVVSARSSFLNASAGGVWVGTPADAAAAAAGADPLATLVWKQTLFQPTYNLQQGAAAAAASAAAATAATTTIFAALAMAAKTVSVSRDGGATWSDFSEGIAWPQGRLPFYPCFSLSADGATLFVGALTVNPADSIDTDSAVFHRPTAAGAAAPWRAVGNNQRLDDDQMPKDRMALLSDPQDAAFLYVAGNGGHIAYRVRGWQGDAPVWEKLWGQKGNHTKDGSAPHCDCRNWAWRPPPPPPPSSSSSSSSAQGTIVLVSDGGIFERDLPRAPLAQGGWRSLNGNIGAMEFLTAHWDAADARWVGGAQDNDVQLAPPACTPDDTALGINFGDGTVTAVDNSQTPARIFGTTQFYGQRDLDRVTGGRSDTGMGMGMGMGHVGRRRLDGDDDDDDGSDDAPGFINSGLLFRQGALTLAVPLEKWFPISAQFPLFVQPFQLNAAAPTQLVIFANGSAGGAANASGWYGVQLPPGLSDPDDVAEPTLLAETEAHASVLDFRVGGVTGGAADPAVLVGVNSTHFYHRASPAAATDAVVIRALPTTFTEPSILAYTAAGDPLIGPVSHGQTVFLAVHPADSSTSAVTGWSSVRDNAAGADSVWLTTDAGDTWMDATGDLAAATATVGRARPSGLLLLGDALLVGTVAGVFVSHPVAGSPVKWSRLGLCSDLPLVLVMGLSHEAGSDTLVAATMGRGIYVLPNATQALAQHRKSQR